MSVFGKIFGGSKKQQVDTPQEAIQKLKDSEEMLIKKQEYLESKIQAELATAKKHGTKNKRQALSALKRKKQYEKQLEHIDGVLSTLEFQREALENASTNTEVLNVMGSAAKAMKVAHNDMDVDKVHDLMEDIMEQQEVSNEISEAISNPIGFQGIDEDELERELESLEQEELDKKLLDAGKMPDASALPEAPTTDLPIPVKRPVAKKQEDDDLAELAAWANA
ncbi:hypothetical protein AB6A40_001256 [Gnathostoma spinigerum]|uniref:Charged multivesicular body protein 4b n=1 Tax=Gnathostoma spinigerum TaxID=75299 RepID=A0ABD6E5V8_9BILA